MATGYDEDGSIERLVCASPPDGSGGGANGGANEIVSNIFFSVGQNGYIPFDLTLGVGDFSFEFWVRHVPTSQNGAGAPGIVSTVQLFGISEVAVVATQVLPAADVDIDPSVYSTFNASGTLATWYGGQEPPGGVTDWVHGTKVDWQHVVANFDRNVQMDVLVNGASIGVDALTDAGAPENILAHPFHFGDMVIDVIGAGNNPRSALGPVALHQVVLTAAQIRESMGRKHVQLLGTTMCAYDWRNIVGHTGWEVDATLMEPGLAELSSRCSESVVSPEGPNGDVVIPDLSGNGRDIALWTAPVYTAAAPSRCAFGSSSFFR